MVGINTFDSYEMYEISRDVFNSLPTYTYMYVRFWVWPIKRFGTFEDGIKKALAERRKPKFSVIQGGVK